MSHETSHNRMEQRGKSSIWLRTCRLFCAVILRFFVVWNIVLNQFAFRTTANIAQIFKRSNRKRHQIPKCFYYISNGSLCINVWEMKTTLENIVVMSCWYSLAPFSIGMVYFLPTNFFLSFYALCKCASERNIRICNNEISYQNDKLQFFSLLCSNNPDFVDALLTHMSCRSSRTLLTFRYSLLRSWFSATCKLFQRFFSFYCW